MTGRSVQVATALAVLITIAAAGVQGANITVTPVPIPRKPVEFSPSVSVFFMNDMLLSMNGDGTTTSRCIEMVERAAAFNAKRINFVITHYFVDEDGDLEPDWYCLREDQDVSCEKFGAGQINAYMAGLKECLKHVADYKLQIFITPHVDDGSTKGGVWRNAVDLDPIKRYDKWSYTDILLRPVAEMLNELLLPGVRVWFCMQGEMNLSVMNHPEQYLQLATYLKNIMLKGKPSNGQYQASVGICMNFNKLQGNDYMSTPTQCATKYNQPMVAKLFNAMDFIGISNYPSVTRPMAYDEMETAMSALDGELSSCNISLKALTTTREMVLCEFGFGGGVNGEGDKPATTANEVGTTSYFGILGPYTESLDPWKTYLPESVGVVPRIAVRNLYEMTSTFLSQGGGAQYRVDGLFLWNVASWDLLGIHWRSYSNEGSYYEPGVARIVQNHNNRVNQISRVVASGGRNDSP